MTEINLLFSGTIAIISGFLVSRFTFYRNMQAEHNKALEKLLIEIEENNKKVQESVFLRNLEELKTNFDKPNWDSIAWLPKQSSFFGMSKFDAPLQYLPQKAYYNFMSRGFYTNFRDEGRIDYLQYFTNF